MSEPPLLCLDGVTVSFDGFKALNELSLVLETGEMRAVIGPNGAGKTTMMDVITGKTRPDSGRVVFGVDTDLTRLDESAIARLGIGRKFQQADGVRAAVGAGEPAVGAGRRPQPAVCAVGARDPGGAGADRGDFWRRYASRAERDRRAGELSHGQKQWLEIGMLLAQEPKLLLVDEPAAGMTDAETAQTAELLREINRSRSLVVVEHDMAFVRSLGARVTVLHEGAVLAEGSIDHVQNRSARDRSLSRSLNHAVGRSGRSLLRGKPGRCAGSA